MEKGRWGRGAVGHSHLDIVFVGLVNSHLLPPKSFTASVSVK